MKTSATLTPLQAELREALRAPGCPLCRLAERAEHVFLDSLNYERVLDIKTRDGLKASRGLCVRHSRVWSELQGCALGIAIVYRVAVLDLLRDTEGLGGRKGLFGLGGGASQANAALETTGPCPACEIGEATVQRFATLLLEDIGDEAVQAALQKCGGLCLPHLRQTLRLPGASGALKALMSAQRAAWQALMGHLDEFIRKNDYRFQHEKLSDAEADSWLRAIDALVGRRKI